MTRHGDDTDVLLATLEMESASTSRSPAGELVMCLHRKMKEEGPRLESISDFVCRWQDGMRLLSGAQEVVIARQSG